MKKSNLSFRIAFKIALQGKWITRIITLLLSIISFSVASLASCGFTFNKKDYLTKGYLYYLNSGRSDSYPYTMFYYKHNKGYVNDEFWDLNVLGQEYIDYIKSTTGWEFAHIFYNVYIPCEANYFDEMALLDFKNSTNVWTNCMYGTEEVYESLGIEMVEGRYPEKVNEIAVSTDFFDMFQISGYCDSAESWTYIEVLDQYYFSYGDRMSYERVEIETYSDLIGKTFMFYGNPETGVYSQGSIYEVKVVGIVRADTPEGPYLPLNPINRIYLSKEWVDIFVGEHDMMTTNLIKAPVTTYSDARVCVDVALDMMKNQKPELEKMYIGPSFVGVGGVEDQLYDLNQRYTLSDALIIGLAIGFFAVLLNCYLVSSSIETKQKKIGVLRSLGASSRDIGRIFIIEALLMGLCIFVFALPVAYGLYCRYLYPMLYRPEYANCMLAYNFWNVLILAAICFAVPLLSTIAPLKKFFRKPIVDNITGNAVKRKNRNRA